MAELYDVLDHPSVTRICDANGNIPKPSHPWPTNGTNLELLGPVHCNAVCPRGTVSTRGQMELTMRIREPILG